MATRRILHIVGRMDRAGAETMLMNLYREIDRTQFQFDFLCFTDERGDYDDEIERMGGHIIRISTSNIIKRFYLIQKELQAGSWQIVHSHTLWSSGLHLLAAKLANIPIRIAHSHNTSGIDQNSMVNRVYYRSMLKLLTQVPTHYIACGKAAAAYLFPKRTDVTLIPNAIDINRFIETQGLATRQGLGISSDKLIILQVGRLSPVKNHSYSLKIATALEDDAINFQMLFVGTGPEQQKIETKINDYDLESYVHLLGVRDDIAELMAAADVLLMPSLHEGFPVVIVESQAANLPVLVADTVSNEVDLGLGLVHFMSLQSDVKEWVANIEMLIKTVKVPADYRLNMLEKHGFSARASAQRLIDLYTKPLIKI